MDTNGSMMRGQERRHGRTITENRLAGQAEVDMKPLGPFRPEPPRARRALWLAPWSSILVLGIGVALFGLALYCLHDASAISDALFLVAVACAVTVSVDVILAIGLEHRASRNAPIRSNEVPPPFDIHTVWPPSEDGRMEQGFRPKHRTVGRAPDRAG
jgi:hypothetical protein